MQHQHNRNHFQHQQGPQAPRSHSIPTVIAHSRSIVVVTQEPQRHHHLHKPQARPPPTPIPTPSPQTGQQQQQQQQRHQQQQQQQKQQHAQQRQQHPQQPNSATIGFKSAGSNNDISFESLRSLNTLCTIPRVQSSGAPFVRKKTRPKRNDRLVNDDSEPEDSTVAEQHSMPKSSTTTSTIDLEPISPLESIDLDEDEKLQKEPQSDTTAPIAQAAAVTSNKIDDVTTGTNAAVGAANNTKPACKPQGEPNSKLADVIQRLKPQQSPPKQPAAPSQASQSTHLEPKSSSLSKSLDSSQQELNSLGLTAALNQQKSRAVEEHSSSSASINQSHGTTASEFKSTQNGSLNLQQPEQQKQALAPTEQQANQYKHKPASVAYETPLDSKMTASARAQQATATGSKNVGWYEPTSTSFSWTTYLEVVPAEVAPRAAFKQAALPPKNSFKVDMKLEALDARNGNWCLASVVRIEGNRLRLRFDGTDKMNDIFELIDSGNIRAIGSNPETLLLPPMSFHKNLATYNKFVEKVLSTENTVIAPPEIFPPEPQKPERNLFKRGMKLEAVDHSNREAICPATISDVCGDLVTVTFDGWGKSYSYKCEFYSRDLFPINWCRDTNYRIQPPRNWDKILRGEPLDEPKSIQKTPNLKSAARSASSGGGTSKNTATNSEQNTMKARKTPIRRENAPSPAKRDNHATSAQEPRLIKRPNSTTPVKRANQVSPSKQTKTGQSLDDGKPEKKESIATKSPVNTSLNSQNGDVTSDVAFVVPEDEAQNGLDTSHESNNSNSTNIYDDDNQVDDDSDIEECDRYSCQRTVPYNEWHKRKREISQPSEPTPVKKSKLDSELASRCQEVLKGKSKILSCWTVEDVLELISIDDTLVKYSKIFTEHEIDGKAFVLLTTDVMIHHLGLKIGPVLKINDLIEQTKRLLHFDHQ